MTYEQKSDGATPRIPARLTPNVAFMGKMGSGKSTAADVLINQYGYAKLSFAGEHPGGLRDLAVRIWGPEARNDRGRLIALGMKLREIDPDVFVRSALRTVTTRTDGSMGHYNPFGETRITESPNTTFDEIVRPMVVDDLRFPNEHHMLRKEGFVIIQVCAHRSQRINRLRANGKLQDESQLEDVSEKALDGVVADYTVANTTTYRDLTDALQVIMEREARKRG